MAACRSGRQAGPGGAEELQKRLRQQGFDTGAGGSSQPVPSAASRAFQRTRGLPRTLSKLQAPRRVRMPDDQVRPAEKRLK